MALKIPTPPETTFHFFCADPSGVADITRISAEEANGKDADNVFFVKFRQGTIGEDTRRDSLVGQRKFTSEDGRIVSLADVNQGALARLEISMTLTDTSLGLQDDSKLRFVTSGSIRRVESEEQFNRWYNSIPSPWANEIYLACLEVNPSWDPSKRFSEPSE